METKEQELRNFQELWELIFIHFQNHIIRYKKYKKLWNEKTCATKRWAIRWSPQQRSGKQVDKEKD